MESEPESKVVYTDGKQVRVVRGRAHIEGEFVRVERRDGVVLIATKNVVSIIKVRQGVP